MNWMIKEDFLEEVTFDLKPKRKGSSLTHL